ncbi:hypothetical protein CLOM_g10948 [Closterium sp. NIES-68]|nr:hypothetical protein CLOM_g10948 [Closterium sp. NIES-68]GJP57816.1 hypothetical protein CLOP_g17405 [Closterium sp. NIES-67]
MAEPDAPLSPVPVRFGILGTAKIARKVIRAMLHVSGVVPYAIGSRSYERAAQFAKEVGMADDAAIYGSYADVIADPLVDAVYIPLPTGLHVEWVVKAANHGKHILLEKPVSLNVDDLKTMIAAVESAGVQIMDGTMWMHNPRAAEMKAVLQDREVFGQLMRVTSNFFFPGSEEFMQKDIRLKKGLDGLGCLGDIGWYCVRASLWAADFELPYKVIGLPDAKVNEEGVLIRCGGYLCWRNGLTALFECGFDAPVSQRLELAGSRSTVTLNDHTIPFQEDKCEFVIETGAKWGNLGLGVESTVERREIVLTRTQEAMMVAELSRIVRGVRGGGGKAALDERWVDMMEKTQRVVCAVHDSLAQGGTPVLIENQS